MRPTTHMARPLVFCMLTLLLFVGVVRVQAQTVNGCYDEACQGDDFVCTSYYELFGTGDCEESRLECKSSPCSVTCSSAQRACNAATVAGLGNTTVNCFAYLACDGMSAIFGVGTSVLNCGSPAAAAAKSCDNGVFNAYASSSFAATFANGAIYENLTVICPSAGPCSVSCVDTCVCSQAMGCAGTSSYASYPLTLTLGNGPLQYHWDGTGTALTVSGTYLCNATSGQWMCPAGEGNHDTTCVDPIGPIGTYSGECTLSSPSTGETTLVTAWTTVGTASLAGEVTITTDVSSTKDCMIVPPAGPVMTGFTISTSAATICCPHAGLIESTGGQCTAAMPCGSGTQVSTANFAPRSIAATQVGDGCILIDSACYDASQKVAITVFQGSEFTGNMTYSSVTKRTAAPPTSAAPLRDTFVYTTGRGYQAAFSVSTSIGDYGCVALGTSIDGTSCEILMGCTTTAVSSYIHDSSGSDCYALCYAR